MDLFVIEDEFHAEPHGRFNTYDAALVELHKRTKIPWNEEPNICPCTNWKECHRDLQIIQYNTSSNPWKEIARTDIYKISASGIEWKK